jgi:hypothetical protein
VASRRETCIAILLLSCIGVVSFWLLAARHASRGFEPFRLGKEDFAEFSPTSDTWDARLVYVKKTPTEPSITAYELRPLTADGRLDMQAAPVLVRIVHGYNMVDCMRIKQYEVDLLQENLEKRRNMSPEQLVGLRHPPMQIWLLKSPEDVERVWISSMLHASDFSGALVDTRSMPFPRVGTPDDPAYAPTGLRWSSFRHPIRNFLRFVRGQWNASRTDLLTFLRLRQPAWASDVLLTMVSEYRGQDAKNRSPEEMLEHVLAAHRYFYQELYRFGHTRD